MFRKILLSSILIFSLLIAASSSVVEAVSNLEYESGPHFYTDNNGRELVSFAFRLKESFSGDTLRIRIKDDVPEWDQDYTKYYYDTNNYAYDIPRIVTFLSPKDGETYIPKIYGFWDAKIGVNQDTSVRLIAQLPAFTYKKSEEKKFSLTKAPVISKVDGVTDVELEIVSNVDINNVMVSLDGTSLNNASTNPYIEFVQSIKKDQPFKVIFKNIRAGNIYSPVIYHVLQNSYTNLSIGLLQSINVPLSLSIPNNSSTDFQNELSANQNIDTPASASRAAISGQETLFPTAVKTTCTDGIDNNNDGRIDYMGGPGGEQPDPLCIRVDSEEVDSPKGAGLVPCVDNCDFGFFFDLLNNVVNFVMNFILIPIFALVLMFMGYQYLMARGNPGMHEKFKKTLWAMLKGMTLILLAWLIVKTLLILVGYQGTMFFE